MLKCALILLLFSAAGIAQEPCECLPKNNPEFTGTLSGPAAVIGNVNGIHHVSEAASGARESGMSRAELEQRIAELKKEIRDNRNSIRELQKIVAGIRAKAMR